MWVREGFLEDGLEVVRRLENIERDKRVFNGVMIKYRRGFSYRG